MAAHRYWRLTATLTIHGNMTAVSEFSLMASAGSVNLAISAGGSASAETSNDASTTADKAFDGNSGSWWQGYAGKWVQWDFGDGNGQDIRAFTISNGNSSSYAPVNGAISYSDDEVTWVTAVLFNGRDTTEFASTTHVFVVPEVGAISAMCPAPLCASFGGGTAHLLSEVGRISSYGGANSSNLAPPPSIFAQGHSSAGERSAELTCPRPTLSAYSGANATLSSSVPTLHITATVTNFGVAALRAPTGSVFASGTVSGTAAADLNAPMATLVGYSGAVCSLTLTGSPTILASGTTGGVGGADIRGPSPRLVSSGMAQGYGSANLMAPAGRLGATARAWITAPSPMLTATGHAVVTAAYEAYAINLNHAPGDQEPVDEVTHYTNFPFNGIVRYQGSYYGWGADGLYLLEGTTDNAAPIQYAVKTGLDDFGTANLKNVASAYFAGRLGPAMTVTLYAGEDGQTSYDYTTAQVAQARTHREKFARGVTSRYFALGVSGSGDLELAGVELEVNLSKRKI